MADTKIIGTVRGFTSWGAWGDPPALNYDMGNLFRNGLPLMYISPTLDTDGKPFISGDTGEPILTGGQGNFYHWFRDIQAVEIIKNYEITLTDSAGVYTRADSAFRPTAVQWCYTFESINHGFRYVPGAYLKFFHHGSTENVFVFVNGQRVQAITGCIDAIQTASLDGLGLMAGEYYPIKFFIVYRDPGGGGGTLYIQTNFELEEEYMVALSQWIIGSGTITPAAGAYSPGAKTITATPSAGYEVASLTINGTAITSGDTVDVSTHSTIAAVFSHVARNTRVCTRDQIIAAALRKCQVLAEGELPTADQIAVGAEALERFMKHMQTDTEFRWLFVQRTQAIAADEQEVVLTNSADILDIYDVFLRDSTNQDIPLRLVDAHWYDSTLQFKSTSDALPAVALAKFWRDPATNIAQVNLSIYPKPAQAYTLYYRVMAKYYNLYTGTDELLQDEIWCDVVVYGLAARLADEYNRTERAVYLEQKFEKLKDAAKRKSSSTRDSLTIFPV